MADPTKARDLRLLLGVARKLRALANDAMTVEGDRELFLTTAVALEARATWMAAALPGERYDAAGTVHLHTHVNLLV
jgi:hypothetical protein